jgi:hypothetical protein
MLKTMLSPIIHIMQILGRFYRTYRSTTIVERPLHSVTDPIMRTRDHDYEVVQND